MTETTHTTDDATAVDEAVHGQVPADVSAAAVSRETAGVAPELTEETVEEPAADTDDQDDTDDTDDTDDDTDDTDDTDDDGDDDAGDVTTAGDRLEREGDIAADYLERLLDVADLDGDIDVDIDGDRAAVAIVDSDEGRVPRRLVGRDGEVLEALQELTRLAVLAQTGERSRLMLDVAGHRAARRTALVARAKEAVEQVRASGERLALEAMTPFERKVVHDAVAAQGLSTESEGVEPHRHVVVLPG